MLPSVSKLVKDVEKIIANPKQEAIKFTSKQVTKAVGKEAVASVKPIHKKIERFKASRVTYNDDIATVAAVADILYDQMLRMEVNGMDLRKQAPKDHERSFPVAFFFSEEAVRMEDVALDEKIALLRNMRTIFKEVMPALIGTITLGGYMDMKKLASHFTSMVGADVMIVKECLQTCEHGVEVADKALRWAASYEATIDQFLEAHRKT